MKYYLDTEFHEGFHKPLFGKKRHFIDLISIGIKAEDGREYYAISNEFNPKDADDWVKKNVLAKLPSNYFNGYNVDEAKLWKSNAQIAQEIFEFCTQDTLSIEKARFYNKNYNGIEFYAYYADYDWVLFCSLFGRMIDLPKGFPMYCKDLKQILDDKADEKIMEIENKIEGKTRFELSLEKIKSHYAYPEPTDEHDALADAKWNFDLYKFIKNKL